METFVNIDLVKKEYFPNTYKKEQYNKMTPEQKGKSLAEETIKKLKINIL